jgi:hypothetical protein
MYANHLTDFMALLRYFGRLILHLTLVRESQFIIKLAFQT